MKRMNLTLAEIAADKRFEGALEHADAWLGDAVYTPVVFTVTRKGKLQWRSVDDAGKVVRQFNWHANARVWVRSTFSWSYKPKAHTARPLAPFPSVHLGHTGPINAGDLLFVHHDGLVRAYPPTGAGAVVAPVGIAIAQPDGAGAVRMQIMSPVLVPGDVDIRTPYPLMSSVAGYVDETGRRVIVQGVVLIQGAE